MLLGVPIEKRTGRLVQVRKGCGQFGSDVYLIRLRDGGLESFENAMIWRVDDEKFVDAFYVSNGQKPPMIPEQPETTYDSEKVTYFISGKWPEVGFIVEKPAQPQNTRRFAMTITQEAKTQIQH